MDVTIRKATYTDAHSISQLSAQLGYSISEKKTAKKLEQILSADSHCIFIATIENAVIGWLHGFYLPRLTSEPFAEIAAMVVNEGHRNMGIGKLLIEATKNWAKEKGINRLRVRCNTQRTDTFQFYHNCGFVEQKEQKVLDLKID